MLLENLDPLRDWLLQVRRGEATPIETSDRVVATDFIAASVLVTAESIRRLDTMGHVIGSRSCSHPDRMAAAAGWKSLSEAPALVLKKLSWPPASIAGVLVRASLPRWP